VTIEGLKKEIIATSRKFAFINEIRLLDETDSAVKFRMIIDNLNFIQVYQNISSGTVNYLLVHGFMRVYGRDCCDGTWHKHPFGNPSSHNFSPEATKHVSLYEFLKEVEKYLITEKWL